jgi:putative addiction module component (TIGR02574 family)
MTKEQLLAAAMALDPTEREKLADELWRSVDHAEEDLDESWAKEVEDRIAAYERGEITAKPAEEVVERLRNRRRQ